MQTSLHDRRPLIWKITEPPTEAALLRRLRGNVIAAVAPEDMLGGIPRGSAQERLSLRLVGARTMGATGTRSFRIARLAQTIPQMLGTAVWNFAVHPSMLQTTMSPDSWTTPRLSEMRPSSARLRPRRRHPSQPWQPRPCPPTRASRDRLDDRPSLDRRCSRHR
jgi:hypothetical protein